MDAPAGIVEILTAWQTYVAALAVVAVVQVVKSIVAVATGGTAPPRLVKLAVQASTLACGAAVGIVPGFLAGETIAERALVGVVAGLLSGELYRAVRRHVPALSAGKEPTP